MPQTPVAFLQLIQDKAPQNHFLTLDLPGRQGIIVLPQNISCQQHIDLLQQLITTLRQTELTPQSGTEISPPTNLDCQVTVEERNQLFKFLQS